MSSSFHLRGECGLCAAPQGDLQEILELAPTPPANELVTADQVHTAQDLIPLHLWLCSRCGHVQLAEIVDPHRLFQHYVYVSGTSSVFVSHFDRLAKDVSRRFALGPSSFVVDIGSNDGTLLTQFRRAGIAKVLGVDPALEIAETARKAGIPTLDGFFDTAMARRIRETEGPADLVCANNVFAHAEHLSEFARGVGSLLAPDGVFVFEVSYLADVVENLLFDTIYHEHVAYHALGPLERFFEALGLRLFDAERVDTHGGSVRCFVALQGARHADSNRLSDLIRREHEAGLSSPITFQTFKKRILERGRDLRERLTAIRAAGQSVAGFGAPAKLTTLMYQFGLDHEDVEFVVDDSDWKQGKYTAGTHIPIVPSSALYERRPDWCIIFAWNFADSIVKKHAAYLEGGGRFIVPLPVLREI